MASRLFLIRHGETEWSRLGRHTGRTDLALTEAGEDEARRVASSLAEWKFSAVFASPLRRASATAGLAGFEPTLDDDLMEWDYGEVEGRTNAMIVDENPGWSKWHDSVPGGESAGDVGARADRFIRRTDAIEGDVACFAHGHLLAIMIARWLEMPAADGRRFPLETATVSVLAHKRDDTIIEALNRHCGPPLELPTTPR
jgi:broad specificity phosphatase PhoE